MSMLRQTAFPFPPLVVVFACLVYALLGLVDHDPWKNVDAVSIGVAHGFAQSETPAWLIPKLAGEIWTQSPPLYFWLGAKLATWSSPLLPFHSGVRLASAVFTLAALLFLALAARGFHGRDAGLLAPLLAISSLGLLIPAHDAQPALVGFAASCAVMAALAWWQVKPRYSAIALGTAIGTGFLGSGLDNLLLTGAITLAAYAFPSWRRVSRLSWMTALGIALVLCSSWPLALHQFAPAVFDQWWASEIQRLSASPSLGMRRIELLLWGTWPVLPFAAWTIWLHRHSLTLGRHAVPIIARTIALLLYFNADDATEAVLPLIAVMVVVASAGANQLRRGAASAFDWFGSLTLTLTMAVIWLGGFAMLTGMPARVAKNFTKPAPNFVADTSVLALLAAFAATGVWAYVLFRTPRTPWRAATRWAVGIVCMWVLIVTLWMPWIDYGKTYRDVAYDLRTALGNSPGCIERIDLSTGQRASLDYFAGIRTVPRETATCRFRLVQTAPDAEKNQPGWILVRDLYRPGDRRERLRLYRRGS